MPSELNSPGLESVDTTWTDHFWDGYSDNVTPVPRSFNVVRNVPQSTEIVRSDTTSGFHKLLKQGKLVPYTTHHVKGEQVQHVLGYGLEPVPFVPPDPSWVGGQGGWTEDNSNPAIGVYACQASLPDAPSALPYGPLLLEALGEAKQGALLALLELAELPKVVDLFLGFNTRLKSRVKKVNREIRKKYKPKTTLEFLRLFGDVWLEYRYGWRQLVYASEDIVRALEILKKDQHFLVSTGRGYASQTEPGSVNVQLTNAGVFGNNHVLSSSSSITREQRAVVALQVSKKLAAIDYNLVALGWELIPYSFVVDWFVNVGDVARAIWPVPHIAQSVATSEKITEEVEVLFRRYPFVHGKYTSTMGRYKHTRTEYKRSPYNGEITVALDVNPSLGISKILDLVGLATGLHKRHISNPYRV